ncbi:hypothetical protein, partial [Azonexus hydrophilus]|uniref:hypothetical protein n=1 Tax=Azonexus hydrophilus TaxID=418702 RepID=UPI0024902B92
HAEHLSIIEHGFMVATHFPAVNHKPRICYVLRQARQRRASITEIGYPFRERQLSWRYFLCTDVGLLTIFSFVFAFLYRM